MSKLSNSIMPVALVLTFSILQGEADDTAMDVNFSGNLSFDKIMDRYLPGLLQLMPLKLGHLNGDTKISGSLLKP